VTATPATLVDLDTLDEIQRRVQERVDAGVEHLFLHTMTADLDQLDLFAKHILQPFAAASPPS
jgi:D-serine deaminase-like pyridoxal phosphate-dependent protein